MARIYISSTFEDLKPFREAAYRVLRQLVHDVVAMEDYVAADARPLERCLADVASCDAYVGLVGFRYGYIPPEGNPEGKSITELEYRTAEKQGKPRLIFIYKGPPDEDSADAFTGAGESGKLVRAFKDELQKRHMVSTFTTPDELGQKVAVAVTAALPRDQGKESKPPPVPPELELLRRSAQIILKLYSAKAMHDTLHDTYLKARVLRADDPEHIDPRGLSDVAAYGATKLMCIDAEIASCDGCFSDAERASIEGYRRELERSIAALRTAAASSDGAVRASAVNEFNQRLTAWLSGLDNVLKELADRLDGDAIRAAIARVRDRYAIELEPVERNLQVLMDHENPVFSKCKALLEEHHGLQDVHDKLPGLFDRLTTDDAELAAGEWRRLKRRLNSARDAWQRFGALPSSGADWEEDVRDDGSLTWSVVTTCMSDVDGMLVPDSTAPDVTPQVVRLLARMQARVEEHFKIVDEALREGYRLFKTRLGQPLIENFGALRANAAVDLAQSR